MIVPNKGLYRDTNEQEQPEGTWRDATNLVWDKSKRVLHTEYGAQDYATLPNKPICGSVNIDDDIIFFLESNEMGIVENNSGYYRTLIIDADFNFARNYPVKAKGLRNAKGQRIVVFTDNFNPPRFINVDDIDNTGFSDKENRLMPIAADTDPSDFDVSTKQGGTLTVGSYIIFYRFITKQGQKTNFAILPDAVNITQTIESTITGVANILKGSSVGVNSGKEIKITSTAIDTTYEAVEFGLIGTTNEGQTAAKLITEVLISGATMNVQLSDFDSGEDIDITEVLAPKAFYQTAADIEVMRDEVLMLDTKSEFELDYQRYALDIRLDYWWVLYEPSIEYKFGEPNGGGVVAGRGFMPGEVYSFYIVFQLLDGSYSKAFHIAGRDSVGTEKNSKGGLALSSDEKVFHSDDTADASGATTNMGYWENQDELYPNSADFNSNGGRDLRGTAVKHHRFPSLQHIKDTHYSANRVASSTISFTASNTINDSANLFLTNGFAAGQTITISGSVSNNGTYRITNVTAGTITVEGGITTEGTGSVTITNIASGFGKTGLPILGITASNVVIPDELVGLVKGWQICYAKRTIGNSIVLGYGDLQLSGIPSVNTVVKSGRYTSAVGNFDSTSGVGSSINLGTGSSEYIRFNNFDLLKNKPEINPAYIKYEYRIDQALGTLDESDYAAAVAGVRNKDTVNHIIHSFLPYAGSQVTITDESANIRNLITDYKYVPPNTITNVIDNRLGEETLALKLNGGPPYTVGGAALDTGNDAETSLIALRQFIVQAYANFYDQTELVLTNKFIPVSGAGTQSEDNIRGGDTSYNYYTYFCSAPIGCAVGELLETEIADGDDLSGLGSIGVKMILIPTVSNVFQRYEDPADLNTVLYPHSIGNTSDQIDEVMHNGYDPGKTSTQYLYDNSFNVGNEINAIVPFNPFEETTNFHRHRIIRSTKFNRTSIDIDLEFLANAFYDMPDDKGFAIGLTEYNDRLLIRHEKTTYISNPRQKIQLSGGSDATVGNNDIFDIEPVELVSTDNGFVGNTSRFNTLKTEFGVILIDDKAGKVFLYSSNLEEISKIGLENYFEENMIMPDQNYQYFSGSYSGSRWNGNKQVYTISDLANRFRFNVGDWVYSSEGDSSGRIIEIRLAGDNVLLYTDLEYAADASQTIYVYGKIDAPFSNGGTIAGYDPELKRIILTKNDNDGRSIGNFRGFYRSAMSLNTNDIVIRNGLFSWNGSSFDAYNPSSKVITLDFNLQDKFWVSRKSYTPEMYVSTQNRIFYFDNSVTSPVMTRLNVLASLGTYSGDAYDIYFEVIHNSVMDIPKAYYDIFWKTLAYNSSMVLQNVTFSAVQLANSYQTKNNDVFVLYTSPSSPGTLRAVKGTWRYNRLKDTTNNPLQDNYLKIIFRDSVPNLLYLYGYDAHFNPINNI